MLQAAWGAALKLVDDKGNVSEDASVRKGSFLRRTCCQALASEDCANAFDVAIGIAKATARFQRTRCGQLPPKTVRRYELLLSLARELAAEFPRCDDILIRFACGKLESAWDR